MIFEAIIAVFLNIMGVLIDGATSLIGAPPNAVFSIPIPFWDLFQSFLANFVPTIAALSLWFVWRQVKS